MVGLRKKQNFRKIGARVCTQKGLEKILIHDTIYIIEKSEKALKTLTFLSGFAPFSIRWHSQVVRQGSAKPSFPSSNLGVTSRKKDTLCVSFLFSIQGSPLVLRTEAHLWRCRSLQTARPTLPPGEGRWACGGKWKKQLKWLTVSTVSHFILCSADTRKYFRAVQLNYLDITSSMGV